jgi:FAD:protein FMN transferase
MTSLRPVPARPRTGRYVEHLMGMPISLALRGRHSHDGVAAAAWADVVADLRWVDLTFSTYRPDSAISRLGRGQISLEECPAEVAEVLALGHAAQRESGGAFTVQQPRDGLVVLDPSGVVKGWAVERAAARLANLPDTDFCLSAGGDMTCRTLDPGAAPWRIGVENPFRLDQIAAVIPVFTGAVATSGIARRGHHIIDGRTGRPPLGVASVTVTAASLTAADIDATAAFALGPDAASWLRTRPGRTALVIWQDGTNTTV